MSLKPVKKSDQNKSWMQPRRDRRKMIQPEYHLIVTEGTETEPPYFNAMGDIINNRFPDKINVKVEGKGDNTLNLFQIIICQGRTKALCPYGMPCIYALVY